LQQKDLPIEAAILPVFDEITVNEARRSRWRYRSIRDTMRETPEVKELP
jgi:hypothetical protein